MSNLDDHEDRIDDPGISIGRTFAREWLILVAMIALGLGWWPVLSMTTGADFRLEGYLVLFTPSIDESWFAWLWVLAPYMFVQSVRSFRWVSRIAGTLTCRRCEHRWVPRGAKATICPACKTKFWNVPDLRRTSQSDGDSDGQSISGAISTNAPHSPSA